MPAAYIAQAQTTIAVKAEAAHGYGDTPLRVLKSGREHLGVFVVYRGSIHEGGDRVEEPLVMDVSVVYEILRGSGVLITGGTLIGAHPMVPGDSDAELIGSHTLRGTGIRGGIARRVSAGDIVIVPAHVPHGFREIPNSVTYLSIRIDPHGELPLQ